MSCSCATSDPPDVYNERHVVARKRHICYECGSAIDPGERYERVKGLWEGKWYEFKTCETCFAMKAKYDDELKDCCAFGELWEFIAGLE